MNAIAGQIYTLFHFYGILTLRRHKHTCKAIRISAIQKAGLYPCARIDRVSFLNIIFFVK